MKKIKNTTEVNLINSLQGKAPGLIVIFITEFL